MSATSVKYFKHLSLINLLIFQLTLGLNLYSQTQTDPDTITNTVDHKNLNLSYYLDRIKYNTEEKLGILPYILANPQGTYLEIGTGGDPIAMLLDKLPAKISPTIIASDIDPQILALLPQRHPQLAKYLNPRATGARLQLKQLDATNMSELADNSLDGINASALVHEIISYAGGLTGLTKFIAESFRVLKPAGVLIYRDPEAVKQKNKLIIANFKTPAIRLFTHIFLVKFLDTQIGQLALASRKYQIYNPQDIQFTLYKKHATTPEQFNYQAYLQLRSHEIDFTRPYIITLPRGLCREIERHYLTCLHDCNPLVFVKCSPIVGTEFYSINYLAHSTPDILANFLQKHNLSLTNDGLADTKVYKLINTQIANNLQALEYGILLRLNPKRAGKQLYELLRQHNLAPDLYLTHLKKNEYLLDYRIFGLLYDQIIPLFDRYNQPLNPDDAVYARWLKREGEETYIYYSDDELMAQVAELSLKQNSDQADPYILCPLSPAHNKFIPRLCYNEVLTSSLELSDQAGYHVKIKEGKRIIHFGKLRLSQALPIFTEIIKIKPQRYPQLQKFVAQIASAETKT